MLWHVSFFKKSLPNHICFFLLENSGSTTSKEKTFKNKFIFAERSFCPRKASPRKPIPSAKHTNQDPGSHPPKKFPSKLKAGNKDKEWDVKSMVPNAYLVQMDHCHYFQNRRDDT